MISIHRCTYCGREFEAKRSDASVCPSRECQLARMRDYWHGHKPIAKPVYLLECRVCGKKFKATYKQKRYCSSTCQSAAQGHYRPDPCEGIAADDKKRIASRRCEVYERMRKFSRLDGIRH
mgnify:CR=1 FL=1